MAFRCCDRLSQPEAATGSGCCLLAVAALVVGYRLLAVEFFTRDRVHFGLDTHADPLLIGSALACFVSARRECAMPAIVSRLIGWILAPAAVIGMGAIVVNWTWGAGPPALTIGYPLVAWARRLSCSIAYWDGTVCSARCSN